MQFAISPIGVLDFDVGKRKASTLQERPNGCEAQDEDGSKRLDNNADSRTSSTDRAHVGHANQLASRPWRSRNSRPCRPAARCSCLGRSSHRLRLRLCLLQRDRLIVPRQIVESPFAADWNCEEDSDSTVLASPHSPGSHLSRACHEVSSVILAMRCVTGGSHTHSSPTSAFES